MPTLKVEKVNKRPPLPPHPQKVLFKCVNMVYIYFNILLFCYKINFLLTENGEKNKRAPQIPYLLVYKSTFYDLNFSPKNGPQLIHKSYAKKKKLVLRP